MWIFWVIVDCVRWLIVWVLLCLLVKVWWCVVVVCCVGLCCVWIGLLWLWLLCLVVWWVGWLWNCCWCLFVWLLLVFRMYSCKLWRCWESRLCRMFIWVSLRIGCGVWWIWLLCGFLLVCVWGWCVLCVRSVCCVWCCCWGFFICIVWLGMLVMFWEWRFIFSLVFVLFCWNIVGWSWLMVIWLGWLVLVLYRILIGFVCVVVLGMNVLCIVWWLGWS